MAKQPVAFAVCSQLVQVRARHSPVVFRPGDLGIHVGVENQVGSTARAFERRDHVGTIRQNSLLTSRNLVLLKPTQHSIGHRLLMPGRTEGVRQLQRQLCELFGVHKFREIWFCVHGESEAPVWMNWTEACWVDLLSFPVLGNGPDR